MLHTTKLLFRELYTHVSIYTLYNFILYKVTFIVANFHILIIYMFNMKKKNLQPRHANIISETLNLFCSKEKSRCFFFFFKYL